MSHDHDWQQLARALRQLIDGDRLSLEEAEAAYRAAADEPLRPRVIDGLLRSYRQAVRRMTAVEAALEDGQRSDLDSSVFSFWIYGSPRWRTELGQSQLVFSPGEFGIDVNSLAVDTRHLPGPRLPLDATFLDRISYDVRSHLDHGDRPGWTWGVDESVAAGVMIDPADFEEYTNCEHALAVSHEPWWDVSRN